MSVTIRGLFREALDQLRTETPDAAMATQAAAAINHCGRALVALEYGMSVELGYRGMSCAITGVIEPCRIVGTTWPETAGRAEALAGAATDMIARQVPSMSPAQRWAVAISVTQEARRFVEMAQEFPAYRFVPQLQAVSDAAVDVLQLAMLYPSTASDRAPLDHCAPSVRPTPAAPPHTAAQDAVSALAAAVHSRVARGEFSISEALACAAVLEIGFAHALTVSDADGVADGAWRSAAAAWVAVQRTCAPLDDGTKANPPKGSPVIAWAAQLEQALTATFGSPKSPGPGPTQASELATTARAVVNQAPDIAADIQRAAQRWSSGAYLLARERALPSYEDRNLDAALATDHVVFANADDLAGLGTALRDASRLSMSLARELDRTRKNVGEQPHPGLAARHGARSTRTGDLAVLKVMAGRAQRSATAVTGGEQWSFASRPPSRGPAR